MYVCMYVCMRVRVNDSSIGLQQHKVKFQKAMHIVVLHIHTGKGAPSSCFNKGVDRHDVDDIAYGNHCAADRSFQR